MNPLTQIKNTQKISRQEVAAGVSESQSWHARFKHSAYIFSGGLPYTLTEGDLLAVFSQYGELVDVNLVRHKDTAKSRGFAFLAYEDQRSTVLAVDNLNGARVGGRTITVDHVDNYKRKRAELEGREESESEEEADIEAEAAAIQAAENDGAEVVRTTEALDGMAGNDDAPWASSTSVFALLNAPAPPPPMSSRAEGDIAKHSTGKRKKEKHKKEKKEKRSKLHPRSLSPETNRRRERPSREESERERRKQRK